MNEKLANIRAFATLIVVLGHTIIVFDPGWLQYSGYYFPFQDTYIAHLKHIIDYFQMELFFGLAGFCMIYTINKDIKYNGFIINKINRLIVPFIVIALLWMIPIRLICNYPMYKHMGVIEIVFSALSTKDCGHLWFLPTLFLMFSVGYIFKSNNRIITPILVITGFILYTLYPFFHIPTISQFSKYLIFFILGYTLHLYIRGGIDKRVYLCLIIIGVLIIGTQNYILLKRFTFSATICSVIFLFTPTKQFLLLQYVNKHSFGIYLFHSPILLFGVNWLDITPTLYIPIQFMIAITVSIFMTKLLHQLNLQFITGEQNNKQYLKLKK